jgi:flagellar motor switch protein FliN/FliY
MAEEQPPVSNENTPPPSDPNATAPAEAIAAAPTEAASVEAAPTDAAPAADAGLPDVDQAAIDELLKQANFEDPSAVAPDAAAVATAPFDLPNFQQVMADAQVSSIDLLRDVELNVKIELGRSRMLVEDVLKLGEGSVVELDKLAGDPVDVFVNDRLVARGEVLVLNDNFCVRVNVIVAGVKEEGG